MNNQKQSVVKAVALEEKGIRVLASKEVGQVSGGIGVPKPKPKPGGQG